MSSTQMSASDIGRRIGASAIEVNRLLRDQGFLYGEPGAYGLTSKGLDFGVQRSLDNGYGGAAMCTWETTHFDPSILDVLDVAPAKLAKAREDIAIRKESLKAAQKVAQERAEAQFRAFQASKTAEVMKAATSGSIDPRKVALIVAGTMVMLGTVFATYKGVQWYRRRQAMSLADSG